MTHSNVLSELDELSEDAALTDTQSDTVLLLSEVAAREVALSIIALLDQIDPHSPEKQETVAHLHDELMDRFAVNRGSYLMLTPRSVYLLQQAFECYAPENESAFDAASDAVDSAASTLKA